MADRDADNAMLKDENKELGEAVTFLQKRFEAIEGKPAPEQEKRGLFGGKSGDKHHKTETPGVTYRETSKGNRFYVWVSDGEGGGKREAVGFDYDEAVERKVELDAAREKVTA